MKIIKTIKEIHQLIISLQKEGKKIGFVPTMGALHEGHLSLVKSSVAENELTVVSVFVNPTQFNNKKDLEKYPRNFEQDFSLLSQNACDIVFAPSDNEMYPEKDKRIFDFGNLDKVMEGKHRPGHFNGVGQIVSKLFEAVPANSAYFGLKDFQQLAVIQEMVRQLKIDIKIVPCPIIREENGLAMSSRNELLTKEQRDEASFIFETLSEIKKLSATKSVEEIEAWGLAKIKEYKNFNLEYLEIVDNKTLNTVTNWQTGNGISACVAIFAGEVRLIDNIQIKD